MIYTDEGVRDETHQDSSDDEHAVSTSTPVTLMGLTRIYPSDVQSSAKAEAGDSDDDTIRSAVTLMGFETASQNEAAAEASLSWWICTFNAKNKLEISIEFKMKTNAVHQFDTLKKYGVRRCSVNGQSAEIVSFGDAHSDGTYDSNEYVVLKLNDHTLRLFYVPRIGWCIDDGRGIYVDINRKVNRKPDQSRVDL